MFGLVGALLSRGGTGRGSCPPGSGGRPLAGASGAWRRAWQHDPIVRRGGVGGSRGGAARAK
eukprot:scaffold111334_cov34-Tisochrysis_lutea.AAC.2